MKTNENKKEAAILSTENNTARMHFMQNLNATFINLQNQQLKRYSKGINEFMNDYIDLDEEASLINQSNFKAISKQIQEARESFVPDVDSLTKNMKELTDSSVEMVAKLRESYYKLLFPFSDAKESLIDKMKDQIQSGMMVPAELWSTFLNLDAEDKKEKEDENNLLKTKEEVDAKKQVNQNSFSE